MKAALQTAALAVCLGVAAPAAMGEDPAATAGQALVQLDHEHFVAAPPEAVWRALTTPEGLRWIAPEVNVDIRIGGPYELFFWPDNPDDRDQEGTRVLAYLPQAMLATSGEIDGTWVVWLLEPEAEGTWVRVSSLGDHPEWASRAPYFDSAMPGVLARMAAFVETELADER